MRPSISVAMATCNGAEYLDAQLKSLHEQSSLPFELVVCDDCSEDETLAKLHEFAKHTRFPVRVFRNERRLGFADNFFKAANLCTGDWIAFCDQDDVWMPERLELAQRLIQKNDCATLVLQNSYLCQSDLSHDQRRFPNAIRPGYYPPCSIYGFWVWPGFLQIVNSAIFRNIPQATTRLRSYYPNHPFITHDKWTCMIANASGGVIVDDEPVALYRRHETAVTGNYASQGLHERIGKSLGVGHDHYMFLSEVALETATYLRDIGQTDVSFGQGDFNKAAARFERISRIQKERSKLYLARSFFVRVFRFVRVASLGGYVGPAMVSMGWKSAGKDILAIFRFLLTRHQP